MNRLNKIRLDFQWEHPILYCLILAVIVGVAFPTVIIGIMRFQDSLEYPYEFLQPVESIATIQLVRIDDSIGLYEHDLDEIPSMLENAGTLVTELDPSVHTTFLADFSAVPCHRFGNDPWPYIEKVTILITYRDSSREWIANSGTFYQDVSSGEASMTLFYFDEESFSALIRSYRYR